MNIDYVEVLNQETGERGRIPRHWFNSKAINNGVLIEVDADQKPYTPELFKSRRVDEVVETSEPGLNMPDAEADADANEEED